MTMSNPGPDSFEISGQLRFDNSGGIAATLDPTTITLLHEAPPSGELRAPSPAPAGPAPGALLEFGRMELAKVLVQPSAPTLGAHFAACCRV